VHGPPRGAITGDDINGTCGVQIRREGDSEDDEATIFFRIVMPAADRGGRCPYTTQKARTSNSTARSTDPDNDTRRTRGTSITTATATMWQRLDA
jgi:hypothetical protein